MHDDDLITYLQRVWSVPALIGGPLDHASWGDADCRDPAATVIRLLVGKLHWYDLSGECDSFGPGLTAFQACAMRDFGPGQSAVVHQYCLDLQNLGEISSLYAWRHGSEPEAFARKVGPLVSKMRASLAPLLLLRLPERIRNNVEDAYAVAAAQAIPLSMRTFANYSIRRGAMDPVERKIETAAAGDTMAAKAKKDAEVKRTVPDEGKTPTKSPRPDKRTREQLAQAAMGNVLDKALTTDRAAPKSEDVSVEQLRQELLGQDPKRVDDTTSKKPAKRQRREPQPKAVPPKATRGGRGGRGGQGRGQARGGRGGKNKGSPTRRHRR